MTRRPLCVLLLLAWAVVPLAGQQAAGLSDDKIAAIERVITEEMSLQSIPGMSVAVGADGEVQWTNGYGYSDLENHVPAKASTVYRLASISKSITAVAAMQLVERGRLDLDKPVREYVPAFPAKRWPVTSRRLLSHIGGIRHYRDDEAASTRHYTNLIEPLGIFADDPLLSEPGTAYTYSTYGFNLLGAVIEAVSGETFMDYCSRNIFKPAGMVTIQDDNTYRIIPNRTRGYQLSSDGEVLNCGLADTSNKIPGGGTISAPADLVRFALAVLDGRLVKPETRTAMWTAQSLRNGEQIPYGLGWNVEDWDGRAVVGHTGGQQGTATILSIARETGTVVAVMTNLEGANVHRISERLLDVLID